jgi:hypothetical protein
MGPGIRGDALALAVTHSVLVLLATAIAFVSGFLGSVAPTGATVALWAQRLTSEFATGAYPAFAFAFSQRRLVGGAPERGTLLFVLVSAPLIAVRLTVTAAFSLYSVANEIFSATELAVGIVSLAAVVTSLAIAFISLVQLTRATRHLVEHFLMLGVVAICLVVSWGINLASEDDFFRKPIDIQYLIVVACSPIAHILFRQLIDNSYSQMEAFLSLFASGLLTVSFLLGCGVQIALLATAQISIFQPAIWLIADSVVATMFVAHSFFSFRVARRLREATYSPLLEDRTLTSIGYASQSGNEK